MKYRTICADPPWPVRDSGRRTRTDTGNWAGYGIDRPKPVPYDRLSVWEIAALPIRDLAETNAHLYLWAVNEFLTEAYMVARAWGFDPTGEFIWSKGLRLGGGFPRICHEVVLVCKRGEHVFKRSPWMESVQGWRRVGQLDGRHSAKPDGFLDMVEQYSIGPYVELFARRHRMGWDVHGFESANTADWGSAV